MTTALARRLAGLVAAAAVSSALLTAQSRSPVSDAAMAKDTATVRQLLKGGADANAAQGDGMTALHWAAIHGDAALAEMLVVAGANLRATTRIGGFTPLHLAAQSGRGTVVAPLLKGGAPVNGLTSTGATPLMLAAASGNADIVRALAAAGAELDLTEKAHGQSALMFASALGRTEAVKALVAAGADVTVASAVVDLSGVTAPEDALQEQIRKDQNARSAAAGNEGAPAPPPPPAPGPGQVAGVTRPFTYNELIGKHGGLTALHFAARQGAIDTVSGAGRGRRRREPALGRRSHQPDAHRGGERPLRSGALPARARRRSQRWPPSRASPRSTPSSTWSGRRRCSTRSRGPISSSRPPISTWSGRCSTSGADPNARLQRKIWYTQYNFDLLRIDDAGATPFWRAAYASDIEAMKLLVARGADPTIPTTKPATNDRFRQGGTRSADESRDHSGMPPVPTGGPDIPPLLAAAGAGYGEGFAGNAHRFAPTGMLAAVKYLIEDLGTDPNVRDSDGNSVIHHAASRGDTEMIKYLVAKGADVTLVNRGGQTTVDMANGPVQRVQPYPETIKLLEGLGAKNNHKCVSC